MDPLISGSNHFLNICCDSLCHGLSDLLKLILVFRGVRRRPILQLIFGGENLKFSRRFEATLSVGERRQVRNAGFRMQTPTHAFNEYLDAVTGGDETSNETL